MAKGRDTIRCATPSHLLYNGFMWEGRCGGGTAAMVSVERGLMRGGRIRSVMRLQLAIIERITAYDAGGDGQGARTNEHRKQRQERQKAKDNKHGCLREICDVKKRWGSIENLEPPAETCSLDAECVSVCGGCE